MSETGALAQISQARRFLEQAKGLTDIKAVKDMAEAARLYARAKHLGLEAENEAAEIKVRADRKLGETLKATERAKAGRPKKIAASGAAISMVPTLAEIGITDRESSDAQAVAEIPDEVFEQVITETKDQGKPLATKPLVREGRKHQKSKATERQNAPARPAPSAEAPDPQRIIDASLRRDFAACMASVSQIAAYDPSRIVEVHTLDQAADVDRALGRFSDWIDRFGEARGASLRPRVVEG